jgi:serine/threonine protein kinase, bacterial
MVSLLAGTGMAGRADGVGLSASFTYPYGLALDSSDTIFVADTNNNLIRQVTTTGTVVVANFIQEPGQRTDGVS